MATLYIEEFGDAGPGRGGQMIQAGAQPSIAVQAVAIGATSAQSAAFNAATRLVRIHTDAACSYRFGANPTAAATSPRLATDSTEYFSVVPGHKVAVIENT